MQKACRVLAADFAAEAPAADARALRAAKAQPASRQPIGLFAVGSLAAVAAGVAFFFVARFNAPTGATSAQPDTVAAAATAEAPARVGGIVQRPALMGDSIFLTRAAPGAGNAPVAPQLAWLTDVQLSPVQPVVSAETLRFETKLINAGSDVRVLSPLRVREETEHRAAFEIRR